MCEELKGFELALWGKKRLYHNDSSDQRWLDDGSSVRFVVKRRTFNNVELMVNDNTFHSIWYSQLTEVFFKVNDFNLCSGKIIKKDGDEFYTRNMNVPAFIAFIEGKSFRVVQNPDGMVAKFDAHNLPRNISYVDACQLVRDLVQCGDYSKAASYLIPSTEYTLVEL